MKLILASNSPRRRELLKEIADFSVVKPAFEEVSEGGDAESLVSAFARGKALDVLRRYPDCLVLGADTLVTMDGEIFSKPRDGADARRMLRRLSGRTHAVVTGVCLASSSKMRERVVRSEVTFLELNEDGIERYIKSGAPFDKAGAYGIQDGAVVASYTGSYTNIVGLPMETVKELLSEEYD